jgi:hypothetical protein
MPLATLVLERHVRLENDYWLEAAHWTGGAFLEIETTLWTLAAHAVGNPCIDYRPARTLFSPCRVDQ